MKKANPQSAPVRHTAAAGSAVLTAPVRRRLAKACRVPPAGRATPAGLGIVRPELERAMPHLPELPAQAPLPPEEVELRLLIEAVYLQTGYDFRNYRRPLIHERVAVLLERERFKSISALQAAILRERPVLERLLVGLTERRVSLFDDPEFYKTVRQEVVPLLRTYPFARIWVAGCGNGGEAYSLATMLLEEGLQERCRIYATDLCEGVMQQAQAGTWPLPELKRAAAKYRRAGGHRAWTNYYTAENGHGRLSPELTRNIVFATHSLLTDASFNEFNVILCRGIMDDFDHILETQVHDLLYGSLAPRGVLALGRHHTLGLTLHQSDYEPMHSGHGLYRKQWPHGSG